MFLHDVFVFVLFSFACRSFLFDSIKVVGPCSSFIEYIGSTTDDGCFGFGRGFRSSTQWISLSGTRFPRSYQ